MAFVIIWRDKSIQMIDNVKTIEDACNKLDIHQEDLVNIQYWEDTADTIYPKDVKEIDISKLKSRKNIYITIVGCSRCLFQELFMGSLFCSLMDREIPVIMKDTYPNWCPLYHENVVIRLDK